MSIKELLLRAQERTRNQHEIKLQGSRKETDLLVAVSFMLGDCSYDERIVSILLNLKLTYAF